MKKFRLPAYVSRAKASELAKKIRDDFGSDESIAILEALMERGERNCRTNIDDPEAFVQLLRLHQLSRILKAARKAKEERHEEDKNKDPQRAQAPQRSKMSSG